AHRRTAGPARELARALRRQLRDVDGLSVLRLGRHVRDLLRHVVDDLAGDRRRVQHERAHLRARCAAPGAAATPAAVAAPLAGARGPPLAGPPPPRPPWSPPPPAPSSPPPPPAPSPPR